MVRCKKWYAFKPFLIVFGRFSSVFGRPIFFQATSRRSNFFSRHLPFFSIFAAAAAKIVKNDEFWRTIFRETPLLHFGSQWQLELPPADVASQTAAQK